MSFYAMGNISLSSSASSISLSNITNASFIKILVLELSLRSDRANVYSYLGLRFNNDSANNYATTYINNGTKGNTVNLLSTMVDPVNYCCRLSIPGNSGLANTWSAYRIFIYGYNNSSQFKTVFARGGHDQNTSGGEFVMSSGVWKSTTTINSITAVSLDGNFVADSKISLYGMGSE